MTTDLSPKEYVKLFHQTGVEPPSYHLHIKITPSVFLAYAIKEALSCYPEFVKDILNSNLAQTLKEEEKKKWWRCLLPAKRHSNLSKSHPWSWALGSGIETYDPLPEQSVRAFVDFVKENFETLRKTKISPQQTSIGLLFSRMKDVSIANRPPPPTHGIPFLQEIFDLCPPKTKKECLLALARDLDESKHFEFIVKNGCPYIPHKNDLFYSQILYFAIRQASTQQQMHEALNLLQNTPLRNKVLGGIIVHLEAPSRINWDKIPNVDTLCALLPSEQQKEVLKEALKLHMRTQDLPPTLHKVWEHEHITKALQENTHNAQVPQSPPSSPKRKM